MKLIDPFKRTIDYLRISVTDRCNYRCTYCMPAQGIPLKPYSLILRYEDIIKIAQVAAELGICKIRITGGEPLIKKNIEYLVGKISNINGIQEVSMTTNGSLLTPEKAALLKRAGLRRVNISLDTLNKDKFSRITRGGNLEEVLRGIDAAVKADLNPVKINMVISADTTLQEIDDMQAFCLQRNLILQRIKQFDLSNRMNNLHTIETERPPECRHCNRIRLTAEGFLKPCLFSDNEIKVDPNDIRASIIHAVSKKPQNGLKCHGRAMSQIGG